MVMIVVYVLVDMNGIVGMEHVLGIVVRYCIR